MNEKDANQIARCKRVFIVIVFAVLLLMTRISDCYTWMFILTEFFVKCTQRSYSVQLPNI